MSRVRSPAYPAHDIVEAIEYIRKIHEQDRQHPVPRDIAAKHMGFSGTSGTSDRAIASLMHYGLAERAGKGEIRVTDLSLRILHPEDDVERRIALNDAAFNPQLFKELYSRYPGRPPAAATLESYLTREGFATRAIIPASKAFLETCRFLQQENAYESGGEQLAAVSESNIDAVQKEVKPMQNQPATTPPTMHAPVIVSSSIVRSDIFTLSGGGEVVANLPETLSQNDYDDFKDWLELMRKKAERKIAKSTSEAPTNPASETGDDLV